MKKILSALLAVTMLLSVCQAAIYTNAETHGYIRGDANDDREISMADVLAVRKYIAGIFGDRDINYKAADTDGNSDITNSDLLTVRKTVAGLLDEEGNNTDAMYHVSRIDVDGRNICRYTIVKGSDNACVDTSAKFLKKYIEEACGIELEIVTDETDGGYMIKYEFDSDNKYGLGKEGFRNYIDANGNLVFVCGSMRGPLYATAAFLEDEIGYRFLTGVNEEHKDQIPYYLYKNENVTVDATYDDLEIPVLSYRGLTLEENIITYYNFWGFRANAVDALGSRACSYDRWGWGVGTVGSHAHSYGEQIPEVGYDSQPCLSAEDTYTRIVDYCIDLLESNAKRGKYTGESFTQISCSPNDNTEFCQCTACKAVYDVEGSIAGTVFRLSNRVCEAVREKFPDIEIYTIAYWDARNPPKMTRPSENVCICYCIGGCNNHTYDDVQSCIDAGGNERLSQNLPDGSKVPISNEIDMEYYSRWLELTDNIMVWYYSTNMAYFISPSPNLFNVYEDFKYLAETGVTGIYCEGNGVNSYESVRGYMMGKMMWNPFMTEEEYNDLFNEFLMMYFGDGWQYIREAIEMENTAGNLRGCFSNNYDRPFEMYDETYLRDNYKTLAALYDEAIEAATTAETRERCTNARIHADFLGLSATYEKDYVNGDSTSREDYRTRWQWMYNYLISTNFQIFSFGGDYCGCLYEETWPNDENDITNPMSWIYPDCDGYWHKSGDRWV